MTLFGSMGVAVGLPLPVGGGGDAEDEEEPMPLAQSTAESYVTLGSSAWGDGAGTRLDPSPLSGRDGVTIVNTADVPVAVVLQSPPGSAPTMDVSRCEWIEGNNGVRDYRLSTNIGIWLRFSADPAAGSRDVLLREYVPVAS